MKHKWILIGACGGVVLSAAVFALMTRRQIESTPFRRIEAPKSWFAPRQLPHFGSNPAREFSNAIADAVEKVMPAVVVIRTEKIQYRIKRDRLGFSYRVPEQLAGEGSGVFIDERGYIITSWHVLEGARQAEVVLNDGSKLAVWLVGFDKATDLAVPKINKEGKACPFVEFGDSDALRVGEVVVAIGSPFSLQSSVTVGHVSQKGRRMQILPYEDFIQTDAAINAGNSGGPLIDVDGRLIGINAAIQTAVQKRGVGIAFAVPSNLAMVVAKSLIEDGRHEWPWVGVAFGRSTAAGVPVAQVWADSSAARNELLPGDLVLEVDGMAVKDEQGIDRIVFSHVVGDTLRFLIQRNGEKEFEVDLLLEEFPGLTP